MRPLIPIVALLLVCDIGQSATVRAGLGPLGPDIRFVSDSVGWAGGAGGILATHDGGSSWRRQFKGQVVALDAADAYHAWALTPTSLLATTDGGDSWNRLRPARALGAIDFTDTQSGWALTSEGRLIATHDGGTRWRRLRAPARLDAICLTSPQRGLAARGLAVFATEDAGGTWKQVYRAPLSGRWSPTLRCSGRGAWVLLQDGVTAGSQGYAVYRTLNGANWRLVFGDLILNGRRRTLGPYAGPFAVVDPSTAFFIGFCPACGRGSSTFFRTTDGGRGWSRSRPVADGYWPMAISFADSRSGLLLTGARAGNDGIVWKSRDGGRSWRRVLSSSALVQVAR